MHLPDGDLGVAGCPEVPGEDYLLGGVALHLRGHGAGHDGGDHDAAVALLVVHAELEGPSPLSMQLVAAVPVPPAPYQHYVTRWLYPTNYSTTYG